MSAKASPRDHAKMSPRDHERVQAEPDPSAGGGRHGSAAAIVPSVPFDGLLAFENVSASPSASVQESGTDTAVFARVRRETASHTGAREIVIDTVATLESATPSLAL